MRAVVQRVSRASVRVDDVLVGEIGQGLLVLVGIAAGDKQADIDYLSSKILELRIFGDENGRMNRSVLDVGGALLVVSQFTLLGDVRKGRRPAFDAAELPEAAEAAYDAFVSRLRASGRRVETGRFQAHMQIDLVNDGPVTLLVDSRRVF